MPIVSTKVTVFSGVKYTSTRVIHTFTVSKPLFTERSLLKALENDGHYYGHLTYRARRKIRLGLLVGAFTHTPDEDVAFKKHSSGHLVIDPDVELRRLNQRLARR